MTSTFDLVIKQSILCRILIGTAAALSVLLYMEFRFFEGSENVQPVETVSGPEQRLVGKLEKNSTAVIHPFDEDQCNFSQFGKEICWLKNSKLLRKNPVRDTYKEELRNFWEGELTEISTQGSFNPKNTTNKTKSYLPKPQPFHVLLNAYHRSGSSYAGRLLSLHNDSFYWFEPLQTTLGESFYNKNGSICDELRPRCEDLEDQDSKSLNRSLEFLIDLYSCNIGKHFKRFNDGLMKSNYFQADAAYRRCRLSGVQPEKCYLTYAKSCVKAKNIVTKIIRLDIHHTKVLLQKYPKLKVLQLMRDPRGIVNCRLNHTSWYPVFDKPDARKRIEDNVKILCSKMRSDMEGARKLARQFPDRVRIIQYEDIVRAQEKQDALYRYIGAAILKGNIHLPYLAGKIQRSGQYSFRDQLSQSSLDIVQEHCSDIIEMLGLRVFSSYDEMRNTNIQVEMRREFPFSV